MDEEEKRSSFKVSDKRNFNSDGTERQNGFEKPEEAQMNSNQPEQNQFQSFESKEDGNPFQINFTNFILSLASSAQISLGLVANPMTGQIQKDLNHAKQTIDILGILDEKTKNNLNREEDTILKQILYNLRMQYVEVSKINN